jgi:hypothetical protein
MNDLLNALTNARPDESDLDRVWGQQDRAATLQRAQRRASTQGRRRRIVRTTAAATVTALVGVPALGAWQQAAAAGDLRDLSRAAAQDTAPVLGEGDFLHVVSRSSQDNSSLFGDGRTWVDHRECWVRWDGQEWCVETREGKNYRDLMRFHPEGAGTSVNDPSPEFVSSWPTDATELRAFLDERVSGSNSHQEALYVAITDAARTGYLPPQVLAAGLEMLAEVRGVHTEDVTVAGRAAVALSFRRFFVSLLDEKTTILDKATGQVIAEKSSDPSSTWETRVEQSEIVRQVPEEVLADFETHGEDRVFDGPS